MRSFTKKALAGATLLLVAGTTSVSATSMSVVPTMPAIPVIPDMSGMFDASGTLNQSGFTTWMSGFQQALSDNVAALSSTGKVANSNITNTFNAIDAALSGAVARLPAGTATQMRTRAANIVAMVNANLANMDKTLSGIVAGTGTFDMTTYQVVRGRRVAQVKHVSFSTLSQDDKETILEGFLDDINRWIVVINKSPRIPQATKDALLAAITAERTQISDSVHAVDTNGDEVEQLEQIDPVDNPSTDSDATDSDATDSDSTDSDSNNE